MLKLCGNRFARVVIMIGALAFVLGFFLLLGGCVRSGRGKIKSGQLTVQGVANAGTPATVNTADTGTAVPLPAGSTVTVTRQEAMPAQPATANSPAVPAQPAIETTVIKPAGPTEYRQTQSSAQAATGTVDTTVAKHAIDVADRRWLLWVAIGCGIAGIVIRSMLPAWPSLSNGLLLAAVAAGFSWKLADIPSWIWLCVLGVVGLLVAGYKRAEWDKNGDGIPDAMQRKPPSTP